MKTPWYWHMDMRTGVGQNMVTPHGLKGQLVKIIKEAVIGLSIILLMSSPGWAQQTAQTNPQTGSAAGYVLDGDYWFNFVKIRWSEPARRAS
jgi:hypothetical protein